MVVFGTMDRREVARPDVGQRNERQLPANWMLQHPKMPPLSPSNGTPLWCSTSVRSTSISHSANFAIAYQELMSLDVGDSAQVYAAFLVYLDLTEVRQWNEVTSRGSRELQLVLLEGREREGEQAQLILALPVHRALSHRWVRSVFDEERGEGEAAAMLLCAVASDSSLVYQRLCPGLLTPQPPVGIEDQGRRQHRKRRLR